MKNIFYALAAVALVGFVGCTKDQGYTPGGDIQGEQIYIDNSTSTFYVKTAAEKHAEAAELKKLSRGLKTEPEAFEDDKEIALKVVRKGGKTAEYTTSVEITAADAEELALFTFPADATAKEGSTTTMVVPVTFAEGESEAKIAIGFDITNLATSYEYEFNTTVIDENTSYYGASSFDFVITHMVDYEFPFTDIGTITLKVDWFWQNWWSVSMPEYKDIKIQIHNDDYKALTAGQKLSYIRLLIPKLMYQAACASIEADDGFFVGGFFNTEDEALSYFADTDGLLLTMTPEYEACWDYSTPWKYPNPITGEGSDFALNAMAGVNPYGQFNIDVHRSSGEQWLGYQPGYYDSNNGGYIAYNFSPANGCTVERSMNQYTYNALISVHAPGSMSYMGAFGTYPAISFTWDTNDLEADWDNYFKVDYVNDIDYTKVAGAGTYKSTAFPAADGTAQSWAQDIYVGMDATKSTQVYFLPNIYSTSTAEQTFGLAMHVEGESLTVIEGQPTGLTVMGKALFASQSSKIASAAEYTADGALKKLTIGLALSYEDGTVLGEYEEVYEFNSAAAGIDAFCGDFTFMTYWLPKTPMAQFTGGASLYQTSVKIEKVGNAGKVKISGLILPSVLTQYGVQGDYYVVGEYDAIQNAIVVPAQFFQGGFVANSFCGYFQPGTTDLFYADSAKSAVISGIDTEASECALFYVQPGKLSLGSSLTEPNKAEADGFGFDVYALESDYSWGYYTSLMATYGANGNVFNAVAPSTSSMKSELPAANAEVANGVAKAARSTKVKKEIALNKVINVEALVK